jgi:hypothetical protein
MYKVPQSNDNKILKSRLPSIAVLILLTFQEIRFLLFVSFTGSGIDRPGLVSNIEKWQKLRYYECIFGAIICLLFLFRFNIRNKIIREGIFVLSCFLMIYFELLMRGYIMPSPR